jgi:hypothetical protein
MFRDWVREENKELEAWCPLDGTSVIDGLTMIGPCPGRDVGTFRYNEGGGVTITLKKTIDL